jgi:hypothetical protein
MITVRLNGGLGNQMFQYAIGRALAVKKNVELTLDINEFDTYDLRDLELDKYNIKSKIINQNYFIKKVIKKLRLSTIFNSYYIEKSLQYDENIKCVADNLYLEGYFQNEKYFIDIRSELLRDFSIKGKVSNYCKEIDDLICNSLNSVSIHVRRGDYVTNQQANEMHGTCSVEYYEQAMLFMGDKLGSSNYFIFSDDINWVKNNLNIENAVYVENNNRAPHEDIYLMSRCSHNIIANSSFSWWGAWLNNYNNKHVVYPHAWFTNEKNNIIIMASMPNNWTRI